jgi:hypothetical protein
LAKEHLADLSRDDYDRLLPFLDAQAGVFSRHQQAEPQPGQAKQPAEGESEIPSELLNEDGLLNVEYFKDQNFDEGSVALVNVVNRLLASNRQREYQLAQESALQYWDAVDRIDPEYLGEWRRGQNGDISQDAGKRRQQLLETSQWLVEQSTRTNPQFKVDPVAVLQRAYKLSFPERVSERSTKEKETKVKTRAAQVRPVRGPSGRFTAKRTANHDGPITRESETSRLLDDDAISEAWSTLNSPK